jgi:hypothetical protein
VTFASTGAITRTNGYILSETTGTPYSPVNWSVGTVTGTFIFPFGKTSSDYIPFTFNVTSAGVGAGTVSVATYATASDNTPYPSGVLNVDGAPGVDNSANVPDRFWIINTTGYTSVPTATITFVCTAAEVGSVLSFMAQRWNTTTNQWDAPLSGQTNATSTSVTVPGVNTFSAWALSGNNTILPITLVDFTAIAENNNVQLRWGTAQEINNDFFTIERSADGETFQALGKMPAKGTTYQQHTYNFVDRNPLSGRSYYRLKQTDFDGRYSFSRTVMVDNDNIVRARLNAYPNPFDGKKVRIEVKGLIHNNLPLKIYNHLGQLVCELIFASNIENNLSQELEFPQQLVPGIYNFVLGRLTMRVMAE